jgi:hypothetical protein
MELKAFSRTFAIPETQDIIEPMELKELSNTGGLTSEFDIIEPIVSYFY